jgi:hypothetical protein
LICETLGLVIVGEDARARANGQKIAMVVSRRKGEVYAAERHAVDTRQQFNNSDGNCHHNEEEPGHGGGLVTVQE